MLPDRLFFPLMIVFIAALVALAAVAPQGDGARSPGRFGHTPTQQTPEARAALTREAARNAAETARARAVARKADEAAARARAQLR